MTKLNKKEIKQLQNVMPNYLGYCNLCKDRHKPTEHFEGVNGKHNIYLCSGCIKHLKQKHKEE